MATTTVVVHSTVMVPLPLPLHQSRLLSCSADTQRTRPPFVDCNRMCRYYIQCPLPASRANVGNDSSSSDTDTAEDTYEHRYGVGALGLRCHPAAKPLQQRLTLKDGGVLPVPAEAGRRGKVSDRINDAAKVMSALSCDAAALRARITMVVQRSRQLPHAARLSQRHKVTGGTPDDADSTETNDGSGADGDTDDDADADDVPYLRFKPTAGDLLMFRGDVLHAVESNGRAMAIQQWCVSPRRGLI